MSPGKFRTPSYRLHKPTGQAVVRIAARDHYLGKHGTIESHEKYDRLIAEWLTNGRRLMPRTGLRPQSPPLRSGSPSATGMASVSQQTNSLRTLVGDINVARVGGTFRLQYRLRTLLLAILVLGILFGAV